MSRPNPQDLMRQLQTMQDRMLEEQQALEHETVSVSVGGGAVKLEMSGHQKLTRVEIAPELLDPAEVDMLCDLLLAGVNEAVEQSQAMAAERMKSVTGGMGLPPGLGF